MTEQGYKDNLVKTVKSIIAHQKTGVLSKEECRQIKEEKLQCECDQDRRDELWDRYNFDGTNE